jgi:hypothetical protein
MDVSRMGGKVITLFLLVVFMLFKSYGVSYVPGTEDIPLMESISFVPESQSVFDTEKGRVVISRAFSSLKNSKIESFYRQVLSNLGWRELSKNKYRRESQILSLRIDSRNEKTFITFELIESP